MESEKSLLEDIESEVLQEVAGESEGYPDEMLVDLEKEKEIQAKATALYNSVQAEETKYLHQKVAYVLNRYEEAQNSDVTLRIKYWEEFA